MRRLYLKCFEFVLNLRLEHSRRKQARKRTRAEAMNSKARQFMADMLRFNVRPRRPRK